jgi:NADPH:quinone reductase-like Zn-dependent oxidoreductase
MKAVTIRAHGDVDVLRAEEVPDPTPGAGEVVVRVKACGLNHLDLWVRKGLPGLTLTYPHILGSDVAGVVHALGSGVTALKVGDAVVLAPGFGCGRCEQCLGGVESLCMTYQIRGEHCPGGYAELTVAPEAHVFPLPAGLSFDEAAAFPLVFLTAWHMLVARAAVRPGEEVLVLGAGSGVGSAAIQIARYWGARVIAAAGSDAKLAKAKELGADAGINYNTQKIDEEVRRLTGKRGVDIVFEHTGKDTWAKSIMALARGGRLVTCGATSGPVGETDIRYVFFKQLSILGSTMGTRAEFAQLVRLVGQRKLRPVVDRVLPLAEAASAHRILQDRQQFGKVVLNP